MSSPLAFLPRGLDHGIDTKSPFFRAWFVGVPVLFFALAFLFRALGWWNFKLKTMKKGKLVDSSTRASDDMAFEIVAGICVTYLAVAGFVCASGLAGDYAKLAGNPYYGYSQFVIDHLVYPMLSYQGWNVLICLPGLGLESLNNPAMIGHHIATGSLAYLGMAPYLHYRALFFFGMAEVTNIPLTLYDIAKKFNYKKDGLFYTLSQATFAVSFIIFRLILWPLYSYQFWLDSWELLSTGKDRYSGKAVHSNFVVLFFLGANLFLTFLQFLWGRQVVKGLLGAFSSKSVDTKKSS